MQFKPSKPVKWITNQSALKNALPALSAGPYLAVDTESNSLFAYHEKVCLIQFSTVEDDYLIDGCANLDLSPLGKLFSDPALEKIFHAAEYDIICMRRDFGFTFNNIFDTMQAARILGFKQIGLASMLENQFRIEPVKSYQKANWGKRPLTKDMIRYARMDTHFLIPLRDRLDKQLKKKGVRTLAQEDFVRLCAAENNLNQQPLYMHINGYHHLAPRQLAVLDTLCRYRDETARRLNRPQFKVIGAKTLYALAEISPETPEALEQIEELSPRLAKRYGPGLITAIQQGLEAHEIHLPKHKRPSASYMKCLEDLMDWRKEKGKELGVQSDIVLPRNILEDIAGSRPATESELKKTMSEVPWRFNHFGNEIMSVVIQGKKA